MFSPDTDRVISRKRINWAGILSQGTLILFLILYLSLFVFDFGESDLINSINTYFLPIFLVIFVVFPLLANLYTRWDQRRKWNLLAEEMGLNIELKSRLAFPEITGTYRAHRVAVVQATEKRGRNRVYFTHFSVELTIPVQENFMIQKRSLAHLNRELTGDEELDKKLTVKISSSRLLQQILKSRRLRQGLIELGERSRTKNLTLQSKSLTYIESGQIRDVEYLRSVLVYLVELSAMIERVEQIGL
jgi:hypothetical protein